ncbi:MAG: DUF4386 family protein [Chloroflexi bacterium]|nr:MAG: DUF4386 family protein [Chloroflexota bacterium]
MTDRPVSERIDRYARLLVWALPIWAVLLFLGTLDHPPPPQTDFAGYAAFTTTTRFLVSHLAASILGAAIGNVGFAALFVLLVRRGSSGLALWALVAAVVGNTVATSVFGAAAFAQPAIGRIYLAGQTASAVALQDDVYGVPLFATALVGVLLLASGLVLFGSAIIRSGWLPRWSGIVLVISAPLFAIIGVILADVVQSLGALGLVASTAWIAMSARLRD